jgi:hypothetical protein
MDGTVPVRLNSQKRLQLKLKCAGLGPWDEHARSENGLRRQWSNAVGVLGSEMDAPNNRGVGKRVQY